MTSDAHSTKRKILIMGLPGSGKKSLAKLLVPMFNAVWLDGEEVRKEANDLTIQKWVDQYKRIE